MNLYHLLCIVLSLHLLLLALDNLSHCNHHLYMITAIIILAYLPLFSSSSPTFEASSYVSSLPSSHCFTPLLCKLFILPGGATKFFNWTGVWSGKAAEAHTPLHQLIWLATVSKMPSLLLFLVSLTQRAHMRFESHITNSLWSAKKNLQTTIM